MLIDYKLGQTSIVLRVKLLDSSVSTGAGKTGLTSSSSGLIISTIASNEATPTVYAQGSSNVESITTLGTYAAPTSGKCRFKEVDSTNHKGIYEIQIADARFAVSSARHLLASISGVAGVAECDFLIPLRGFDPYDGVRLGLTALPNVASGSAGAILTDGTGTAQIANSSGKILVQPGTAAGQINLNSGVVDSNTVANGGVAGTFSGGRQEVNVTHLGGTAGTFSGGIPAVNQVQVRGVQPNNLISGRVDATVGANQSGVITAAAFATDAIDANALAANAAAEIVAAVKAMVIESNGSITHGQAMSVILSALAGVTANGGNTLKDPSGTSTRITGTTDVSNNRTAITLNPST